jgi:hypothetical protein
MTDEKLAELHATAAERADSLIDNPTIAGSQPYVTEPKPYHADALTPANHVAGNIISLKVDEIPGTVETPIGPEVPSADDLDAVVADPSVAPDVVITEPQEQSNG